MSNWYIQKHSVLGWIETLIKFAAFTVAFTGLLKTFYDESAFLKQVPTLRF
jgi:hypothetical protein